MSENSIKQWLLLEPLDTLFFRGSDPMIAGESHEVNSLFPPMPSTLVGALRTAVLRYRKIDPGKYVRNERFRAEVLQEYPLLGDPGAPGFRVAGPLLHLEGKGEKGVWLYPAPAHWFAEIPKGDSGMIKTRLYEAVLFPEEGRKLGLRGGVPDPLWVRDEKAKSLGGEGFWITESVLVEKPSEICCMRGGLDALREETMAAVSPATFLSQEERTGVALAGVSRRVRAGYLYTATHVRLARGVSMAVGLSEALIPHYLPVDGVLQLGGEQRWVRYRSADPRPLVPQGDSDWICALSPFPVSDVEQYGWRDRSRASGKLLRMGGWDMATGFHKPMQTYLPAGTAIHLERSEPVPFGFFRI